MKELNLRTIEARTWTSRHQDGLFDVYFGLLMLAISLSALVEALGAPGPARIAALVVLQFSAAGGYTLARRRYVTPRLGTAKFGVGRVRRSRALGFALGACVLVTAGLVALTAVESRPLGLFSGLGRFALPTVVTLVVGTPLAAVAVLLQFPRVLLHLVFFVGATFGLVAAKRSFMDPVGGAIAFGACGTASILVGLVYLRRFLRWRIPEQGGDT